MGAIFPKYVAMCLHNIDHANKLHCSNHSLALSHCCINLHSHPCVHRPDLMDTWDPFHYPIRRLIVRSREVSKPRGLYLKILYRFEICQAPRQHCCRYACQISKRDFTRSYDTTSYRLSKQGLDDIAMEKTHLVRVQVQADYWWAS